jgi:hypothetical protein
MFSRFWLLRGLKFLFFGILFIAAIGLLTMTLWNHLIPALFHGPVITIWQAFGLLVLARLLTGFPGGGHRRGAPWAAGSEMWRAKMEKRLSTMTEEQRAECRARMAKCGGQWAKWAAPDSDDDVRHPEPAVK